MVEDAFGAKDMLILLDKKLDKVLDLLSSKADIAEVKSLRDRMHKVEGREGALTWVMDEVKDLKRGVNDLDAKVEHLENTQVTEKTVRDALNEQREKQRRTIQWAVGILASLGIWNLIVNLSQGGVP